MSSGIAIVGMACRYADAHNPRELWENALAGRRAFRPIPDVRLPLEEYWSADRSTADSTYVTHAAVISNFEFDRARYHVSAASYRAADPAHWLALDCAATALEDAGWAGGRGLDRDAVGVLVGNSLTGDYSRAASMRLRWPYVRRVVSAALEEGGVAQDARRALVRRVGERYREPFPEVDGETLAGWLSNTIAGRVCNHFGFHGGGYTVDGACASSLLAVATACNALTAGDLDVALAGGVDFSLDPLELVGFARAGALAIDDMRVYDRDSGGFWPGEGCGFVVLMREADARAAARRVYAVIRGWGVSSDGHGGLTRPEAAGQTLAIERAYRRAGYAISTVGYFEGHGTGTRVGDQVEVTVLASARRRAGAQQPAVLGSIKANIGHTKAAAGVAGLIKATMAVHRQVLPPTVGCIHPRPELVDADRQLATIDRPAPWPGAVPLRAGVSSMGFGGINAHVTLESAADIARRFRLDGRERQCLRAEQDAELVPLAAETVALLLARIERLRDRTGSMSRAELTDLAVALQRENPGGAYRTAVIANDPRALAAGLERASAALQQGATLFDPDGGVFAARAGSAPRIAFLFPGQGSPHNADGGRWTRRFARVRALYRRAVAGPEHDTRSAQLAITRAALTGLRILQRLGVEAHVATGHSLGELLALHWGGAIDDRTLMRIVEARGRAMADWAPDGAMASIAAGPDRVRSLISGSDACIAAYNTPSQTIVAGSPSAVHTIVADARRRGLDATLLRVRRAFHSELMRPCADALRRAIEREPRAPIGRRVYSTVTGLLLSPSESLPDLLVRQLVNPVRFTEAAAWIAQESDLAIEVGPGTVIARLARACGHPAAVSLDAAGPSLAPLMQAIGAAYTLGAPVRLAELAAGRFSRPLSLDTPQFLVSPCEQGATEYAGRDDPDDEVAADGTGEPIARPASTGDPLQAAIEIVAHRAELPIEAIRPDHRLLADLHFNSLTAAQIAVDVAERLGAAPPATPSEYADASIEDIVDALTASAAPGAHSTSNRWAGVDSWVRTFRVTQSTLPAAPGRATTGRAQWRVHAAADHPLGAALHEAAAGCPGAGTIVCLPSELHEDDWLRLTTIARDMARGGDGRFVIVHDGDAGVGLGASLVQEVPQLTVVVVQVPFDAADAGRWVLREATSADRFAHVSIARDGTRHRVQLETVTPAQSRPAVHETDVVLVSGGAKGIGAECALALAKQTGAALALIGRADPDRDEAVAATLARMTAAGVRFAYERADVGSRDAVRSAVARLEARLGAVTGIVHAAGVNRPALLADLSEDDVREALAAKVAGARHLVEAVDMSRVRLLVAFGSLIARTGMRGDAHYALANEALRLFVDSAAAAYPGCRCLTLESSVWAGVGMGDRLGRLSALERQGITPLTIEQGIDAFLKLLADASVRGSVVVSGRMGDLWAQKVAGPALPLARFLETPRVWYPGIELVADAEVSVDTDEYVNDHVIDGQRVFPAVLGLEAMAQAAAALTGTPPGRSWQLRDVCFDRPIVIPQSGRRVLRVAALAAGDGDVRVVLRSDVSGFAVDHFSMRCVPDPASVPAVSRQPGRESGDVADASALYDELLFQRGPFRRVNGYRELRARRCIAEIAAPVRTEYFGAYHSPSLWLGDPGVRDAVIHALQACVPMKRIVPVSIDRLTIAAAPAGPFRVEAHERAHDGAAYIYDVAVSDTDGQLLERWDGLHLRDIGDIAYRHGLPALLLEPWLEREWKRLASDSDLNIARLPSDAAGSGLEAVRTLWPTALRRPDGRPDPVSPGVFASATHDSGVTIGMVATAPVGCDLARVCGSSEVDWPRVLGPTQMAVAHQVMRTTGEPLECSATRVWAAVEALRKCGVIATGLPLVVTRCTSPVVRFRAGEQLVATTRLRMTGGDGVFALVVQPNVVAA